LPPPSLRRTTATGESSDDAILGTDIDDNIWSSLEGDDLIDASACNDVVGIGDGNVTVAAGSGEDFVYLSGIVRGYRTRAVPGGSAPGYMDPSWSATGLDAPEPPLLGGILTFDVSLF